MEGGSGGSFSLESHFISQSGVNSIDTSIRVTNTSNADLAFGDGANSEGATVYYLPSGHIPSTSLAMPPLQVGKSLVTLLYKTLQREMQ